MTMKFRGFLAVVLLVFACLSAGAEPKAFELVKYKGKAEGVSFALDYGAGYPDASRMWVTDRKSGKTTRFMLDESGEMRFVPKKPTPQKREVALMMSVDGGPLAEEIEGTYTADGKQLKFTLRKIE
jgi:P pilus assembly chaperone PapD